MPADGAPGSIAPERLARILAPFAADGERVSVRLDDADGRVLAGTLGAGATASCTRELVVDGTVAARLLSAGRDAEAPAVSASLDALAVALVELATEGHADRGEVVRKLSDEREQRLHQIEVELAHGRQQQRRIVSLVAPKVRGWELASHYEAAREVGGDFFEFIRLRKRGRPLSVVIADVTGKGIAAALLMAYARPVIHGALDNARGPADALSRTNRILVEERRSARFITALAATVEIGRGTVHLANAGHEPPLLVPADGSAVRPLGDAGPLLGVFPRLDLVESTIELAPGDLVLFYTDGVTDAQGPDGDRFGDDRLLEVVESARGGTAQAMIDAIRDAVAAFADGVEPADDVTIVAMRRVPTRR